MAARVVWSGLNELKAQLRELPAALTDDASGIVNGAAQDAKAEIYNAYPSHTGNLRNHLVVGSGVAVGRFGTSTVLKNTAKHAWIFENGSAARHYITVRGNRHLTGRMPPGHVFLPIVIRKRREMYQRLKVLLVEHGLSVSGDV